MMLVRRRTEITVETYEVLVVRPSGGVARGSCDACGGPTHTPAVNAQRVSHRARVWRLCAALRAWLVAARAVCRRSQSSPSELTRAARVHHRLIRAGASDRADGDSQKENNNA